MTAETNNHSTILLVDDTPGSIGVVQAALEEAGYRVAIATNGEKALHRAALVMPDLILLDVLMPGLDGYETCRRLKAQEATRDIPVIFLSGLTETFDKVKGFGLGAVDYLTKPIASEELLARVRTHVTISRLERDLRAANRTLEERVAARTVELSAANERLIAEIEERKRTGEALRQSEQKFRAIFDQTFQFIGVLTIDGILVQANQTALQFAGVSKDAVLGKPFWETPWWAHSAELQEKVRAAVQEAAGGKLVRFEATHATPDGQVRHIDFSLKPVTDAEGRVVQLIPEGRDITERKQAEAALEESEESFRTLAESVPQIVWATRADGWNIYFNQRWVDYTGMTLAESYGHGWNIPFHPDDQQRAREAWQQATQHGGRYSLEVRLRRADGVYRWWLVRGVPLLDAEGKTIKWFGTCTDIHDLKVAEEEIRKLNTELEQRVTERTRELGASEERMRLFFEHQLVGTAITSPQKGWVQVNDKLCQMLGYSRDELTRLTWAELTYPDDLAPDVAQFERLLKSEIEGYTLEKRFVRKDGSIVFTDLAVGCVRRPDRSVDYILALLEDITERKHGEESIQRLNTELQQRAVQLETTNQELQRMNKLFVGRELRMVALKERLRRLEAEAVGGVKPTEPGSEKP